MYNIEEIQYQNPHPLQRNQSSIRILQIIDTLNRGGAETWLMHIVRNIDRERFQMDFLVHNPTRPGDYSEEIHLFGSRILLCPNLYQPWIYAKNFKYILHEYGPYDIVHVHAYNYLSGYILHLAKQFGVPTCIAHSHIDSSLLDSQSIWYKRLARSLTKWWTTRYATVGLGCSRKAVASLFGNNWARDLRWQVLYYGIDLTAFRKPIDSVAVRAEFGIPEDALVIGHVGRFAEQKNHQFLLEIAAEVLKQEPKMYLLLVGEGSLRPQIEQKVDQLGLTNCVIFAGSRSDVPQLMLGVMDVFLFPSLYEGLGLVLVEAQAAGVPCVFSDVIPEEANVIKQLIHRLSLKQTASVWADKVLAVSSTLPSIGKAEALAIMEQSRFNFHKSLDALTKLYESHAN